MKRVLLTVVLALSACGPVSAEKDSGTDPAVDSGPSDAGCTQGCVACCIATRTTLPDGGYGGSPAGVDYICQLECSDGGN